MIADEIIGEKPNSSSAFIGSIDHIRVACRHSGF